MPNLMTPEAAKFILTEHDSYYEDKKKLLFAWKSAYMTDFWKQQDRWDESLTIETADGYAFIESYVASLFSKNPAVVVETDLRGEGNPEKAQAVVNDWLRLVRSELKKVATHSLIYGLSCIKLIACDEVDIFKRIQPVVLDPWEVIVDYTATKWEEQRYVGHAYWMPMTEVKKKWPRKQFEAVNREFFFEEIDEGELPSKEPLDQELFQYVRVIEFYSLEDKKVFWYSPQYVNQDKFFDEAPLYLDSIGKPVIPIVPFYFVQAVDKPLEGYSTLKRVYDQLVEINTIRTFQANAVRKASRQWFVRKDALGPEELALIEKGVDGQHIPVADDAWDKGEFHKPVEHTETPKETYEYYENVRFDLDKGSITAPFTRGEATDATATEVTALAAYTSTEIGNLARERDASIEFLAYTYLTILSFFLEEEKNNELVVLNGKSVVIKPKDVRALFRIHALDNAATPLSELAEKQEFMSIIEVLAGLGVPQEVILEELVRKFDLSESFKPENIKEQMQQEVQETETQPRAVATTEPLPTNSPEGVQTVLPNGETI